MAHVSDILIVGAGLAGLSIAYELSKKGQCVVVLDSGGIGGRTSTTNQGGVRQQFRGNANVIAGTKTLQRVLEFESEFGVDPDFRKTGYVFLFGSEAATKHYSESTLGQNDLGIPTVIISPREILEMWPSIDVTGLAGATFNPDEGCVNPVALTNGFYQAALRNGVKFQLGEEVVCCDVTDRKIAQVRTVRGTYSAGIIVNACGPWSGQLAELYGRSLPITARLSPIYLANDGDANADRIPMIIDVDQRITVCPNPRGTMVGCSEKVAVNRPGWVAKTDWSLMPKMVAKARRRCAFLKDLLMTDSLVGYWEVTPDDHPIIGHDKSLNLFTSAGFSGHGVSIIPGLAESIAASILGEAPEIDLGLFDPYRFERGVGAPTELWGSADWGVESGITNTLGNV